MSTTTPSSTTSRRLLRFRLGGRVVLEVDDAGEGGSVLLLRAPAAEGGRHAWEAACADLFARVMDGTLDVSINQTFALEDVAAAHNALAARQTTGCTVLTP